MISSPSPPAVTLPTLALLCAALSGATLPGCHSRHPLDEGVLHHGQSTEVTVYLRDGRTLEAMALPRADGAAWYVVRGTVPADRVASVKRMPPLPGAPRVRPATVVLRDGTRVAVLAISSKTGREKLVRAQRVPTAELLAVDDSSHTRGLFAGLGIGVLAGGGLGALIGSAAYEEPACARPDYAAPADDDSWCLDFGQSFSTGAGALFGAVIGGLVGALVGGTRGMRTTYGEVPGEPWRASYTPAAGGGVLGLSGTF